MPPVAEIAPDRAATVSERASCSVLVVSCDRYKDLWPPFFHLFWKHWPACPFPVYLGANFASWHDPRVATIQAGPDESWSKSLKLFLDKIPSRYVLLLLEDFFLEAPVSNATILEHLDTLDTLEGTALRLRPNPPPDVPLEGYPAIGGIHRFAPYRVSAQPGIWNRTGLLAALRDSESAWQFEHLGTVRSQSNTRGYYCTRSSPLPCRHVVERGKWYWRAARYYRKQNIGCDFAARPVMNVFTATKKYIGGVKRETGRRFFLRKIRRREISSLEAPRVVLLTNLIPPYHKQALDDVAQRYANFRILLSTPMESNRPWKLEWGGLDVVLQKTITLRRRWRHPAGFSEPLAVHLPIDTLTQLRRYRPDIIISGEMGMRTLLAALYRKLHRRARLIVWAEVSQTTEQGRGLARRIIRSWLRRQADAFLAVGASGARYLRSIGVSHAKIFRLLYTTDIARFSANELTRPPDCAHRLLYVGQLIERKGLLPFLTILSKWASANPRRTVEFVLAGDGPLRSALQNLVVPENLRLSFTGNLAYEDLPRIYAGAGLFVLPTLADTWAVVVNEALAAGLPILGSTRAQAVDELLADGKNGWIFDPQDSEQIYAAIDRAMGAPCEELDKMRAHARSTALAITPSVTAQLIDDAIAACLESG